MKPEYCRIKEEGLVFLFLRISKFLLITNGHVNQLDIFVITKSYEICVICHKDSCTETYPAKYMMSP